LFDRGEDIEDKEIGRRENKRIEIGWKYRLFG